MHLLIPATDSCATGFALMLGTLISEDLTCISAGVLISQGTLNPIAGLLGCLSGIYFGDLGLWGIGRLMATGLFARRWIMSRVPAESCSSLANWFDEKGWRVILASRFLPGTRLPLYVACGLFSRRFGRFALWTLLAACLWTPLVIGVVAICGQQAIGPLRYVLGASGLTAVVAIVSIWGVFSLVRTVFEPSSRRRLAIRLQRWRRYEFWPTWIFYLPLIPYLVYLSLRYRGMTTLTAVNPGIPQSGIVGESKFEILSQLPPRAIVPSAILPPGKLENRCSHLEEVMQQQGWRFPLVLKPDASQRGAGVRKIHDWTACRRYFANYPVAVLAQTYHPGPYEAGVFYYRMPGQPRGHIFSITEKVFPVLIGDGVSTIGELIMGNDRFRLQSDVFFARHVSQLNRVLAPEERFPLAMAGNHCQGTMFRDGEHLYTPELERAIDQVARTFRGFYMGRFDIRFSDIKAFKEGRGWSIVELNGVTSESTNLYDPSWSLVQAYCTLARQWRVTFQIGDLNRAAGHTITPLRELLATVRTYYRDRRISLLSD